MMKSKSIIALIFVAGFSLALTSGCRISNKSKQTETKAAEAAKPAEPQADLSINAGDDAGYDLPEKEEIRRKFQLDAEPSMGVYNINGTLTVETADTNTAEILVVRSAKTREDLENYRKVKIEQQREGRLIVSIENDRKSLFSALGKIPEGRQRVVLKIPRKINFETFGVSGNVTLGEIIGRLELRDINGQIKASRIAGVTEFGNVNGGIEATFAPLNGKGIEVFDVNGNVDLHFEGEVNAELDAWGINGKLNPDLPSVQAPSEEQRRGRLKARIGSGGTPIKLGDINGNINLLKAEKVTASSAKASGK